MRYLYDILAWYEVQKQRAMEQAKEALEGQGLVEYALIIFLVSVAAIVVLGLLGRQIVDVFNQVVDALSGGGGGGGGG